VLVGAHDEARPLLEELVVENGGWAKEAAALLARL
jgi:hypothetical protein